MKHWHRLLVLGTVVLSLMASSYAFALDAPTLQIGIAGHAKQALTITAGPSGAPNGFTVRWMDQSTFLANGGQFPPQPVVDESGAAFTGAPTLNTFGGQYTTFQLGPNQTIVVEIGDLFTETGVTGTTSELASGVRYYYAAFANDENGQPASGLSVTSDGTTTESVNCTFTLGFWKTHPSAWPVNSLMLGNVNYTKAELLTILGTSVGGNGLVSLAHQLIAAKVNIANGADPTAAAATIAAADAQIGNLVVPPVGSGYIHPSQTSTKTQSLDDYNNGISGPGHCGTVATESKTWGQVKALFR
jgi:hypothetical protein